MPERTRKPNGGWKHYHFTCPICLKKHIASKSLADRRYSPENVRTRTMRCRSVACEAAHFMGRTHREITKRSQIFVRDRERIMRNRKTPEGRVRYYNKYGPPSGRPISHFDITRLHNSPNYEEYARRRYANYLKKKAELNLLLGMFNMAKKASYPVLTPQAASRLRGSIMARVPKYLEMADEVMSGERKWSATQARIFSTLLNKVIPDLSASFVQHEHTTRDLRELSRDELERIARGDDAITVEYSDADHKSRETAPLLEPDPPGAGPGDEEPQPR